MEKKNKKQKPPSKAAKDGQDSHKANWREVYATVDDIKAFLDDNALLRYNTVTGRLEGHVVERDVWEQVEQAATRGGRQDYEGALQRVMAADAAKDMDPWHPITDRDVNTLWARLSEQKPVRKQDLQNVLGSEYVADYNPFLAYLDSLPRWTDNQDNYIMELSLTVSVHGDADEQLRFYEYLRKWLVAMVAGWVNPTVVNNVMLVLIGRQGAYKTTWFSYLLPPELKRYFYTKTDASRMSKDDLLVLAHYALVCYEELDTMTARDLNNLKSAMTMQSIDERAPYERYHDHRPHVASFCGTGNSTQFLSDTTGNRRWLPFEVDSIESPREHPFNYAGIYAQAYSLYRDGFQYWFGAREVELLTEHNRHYETPRLEQELVSMYFRKPHAGEPGEFLPVAMAMQIVGAGITQKLSAVMLGRAFQALGFKSHKSNGIRGYIVVRRSADEMRSMQQQMSRGSGADGADGADVF